MSLSIALIIILVSAFLWGSWGQFIKRINPASVPSFMFFLYLFSLVVTWGALIIFDPEGFLGLGRAVAGDWRLLAYPLAGGILYTTGMMFNMAAVSMVGLTVTFIVFSSVSIVFGTLLSVAAGGLPPGTSYALVGMGCVIMLGAVILTAVSQNVREGTAQKRGGNVRTVIVFSLIAGFLISSFPFFMTLSIRKSEGAPGLDAYQYMALLSLGSMIVAALNAFRTRSSWSVSMADGSRNLLAFLVMAAVSAFAHYGGNVINAVAAPHVGMALSWPMSQTMVLWSTFWGLLYGEYRGASRPAVVLLAVSLGLFALGTGLFTYVIYL